MVPMIPVSNVIASATPVKPAYVQPAPQAETIALAALLTRPRVGLRVGAGNWSEAGTTFFAGADVTLKLPVGPVPALRFDVEGWSEFPPFTSGSNRGDAVSVMAVVSAFSVGYAGLGPSYWHTNGNGRDNGIGAKALVGVNLVSNLYVEGSIILGPKNPPLAVTVGMRF